MCGCFVVALGAFFPRVALVLMWLFGDTIENAFGRNWLMPLLGIIFLPFTTLVYVLIYWWQGGVVGFSWFFVALGFILDVGSYVGGAKSRTGQPA